VASSWLLTPKEYRASLETQATVLWGRATRHRLPVTVSAHFIPPIYPSHDKCIRQGTALLESFGQISIWLKSGEQSRAENSTANNHSLTAARSLSFNQQLNLQLNDLRTNANPLPINSPLACFAVLARPHACLLVHP
jgi:hypothetical protein